MAPKSDGVCAPAAGLPKLNAEVVADEAGAAAPKPKPPPKLVAGAAVAVPKAGVEAAPKAGVDVPKPVPKAGVAGLAPAGGGGQQGRRERRAWESSHCECRRREDATAKQKTGGAHAPKAVAPNPVAGADAPKRPPPAEGEEAPKPKAGVEAAPKAGAAEEAPKALAPPPKGVEVGAAPARLRWERGEKRGLLWRRRLVRKERPRD